MSHRPRSWLRFSLRTLFVAVTILCAWLGWETRIVRGRRAVLREVEGNAAFQVTTAEAWAERYPLGMGPTRLATISPIRRMLGDRAVQEVWFMRYYQGFSEAQLDRLTAAFPEAEFRESYPEPCHPGCFPSGTQVETPSGARPIETIQVGDLLTIVLPSGQTSAVGVQSVFVTSNRLCRVETDGGSLLTTQIQPLCLASEQPSRDGAQGWERTAAAGDLSAGDRILHLRDGELEVVTVRGVFRTERIEKVFNLVLNDSESFIAGGFVARSKPPADEPRSPQE